jgi:hypothetical protein
MCPMTAPSTGCRSRRYGRCRSSRAFRFAGHVPEGTAASERAVVVSHNRWLCGVGHLGWKDAAGRASYSLASGVKERSSPGNRSGSGGRPTHHCSSATSARGAYHARMAQSHRAPAAFAASLSA